MKNEQIMFKNCASIPNCISEIITQIDNTKDLEVVIPMRNSIEYISKLSGTIRNLISIL